jgi:hypothetical protein
LVVICFYLELRTSNLIMFLNPWALVAIAALAVPILLHLTGRRRPHRVPFPTLRFVPASALPRARRKIEDIVLLIVRCGVIAAAVAAVAQPLWPLPAGDADAVARAIVVDVSASMSRRSQAGTRGVELARARAREHGAEVRIAQTIESEDPRAAVAAAAAWLSTQTGRREIVVLSDFQAGAIDDAALARVPTEVGVRFEAIDLIAETTVRAAPRTATAGVLQTEIEPRPESTRATWTVIPGPPPPVPIALTTDPATAPQRRVLEEVARMQAVPVGGSAPPVQIAFEGSAEDAPLAASGAIPVDSRTDLASLPRASRDKIDSVRVAGPIDSVDAAETVVAVAQALAGEDLREHEPNVAPLRERSRDPFYENRKTDPGSVFSRWCWGLTLALIAVEWWLRRRARAQQPPTTAEALDVRVA